MLELELELVLKLLLLHLGSLRVSGFGSEYLGPFLKISATKKTAVNVSICKMHIMFAF